MTTAGPATSRVRVSLRSMAAARLADYLELTKPRIAGLVLVTVTVGYVLGSAGRWELLPLCHALFGIGLVAAGASALNQLLERKIDGRMRRTAERPLPAGRLLPAEVLAFGVAAGLGGCLYLLATVNLPTAVLAAVTLLLYVGVYTPLKRKTTLCTAVGALPGALPPVLGWSAASGGFDSRAVALFGILFLWQFPHFLSIAWLYRHEYRRAGLLMLPAADESSPLTGYLSVLYALVLLPVALLPSRMALTGTGYFVAAVVLGLGYVASAARFSVCRTDRSARGLLLASVLYLPLLLVALVWDHLWLLS